MTGIQQIADTLVALCREWRFPEAQATLFHENAVNIEPDGRITTGLRAIREKEDFFLQSLAEKHLLEISDTLVTGSYAVRLKMDVTTKQGVRRQLNELCVYEVTDNKIIRELFYY